MNIYQNIEVYLREFDSKLFTSIFSAHNGNTVFLSPLSEFKFLMKWINLPPGIFHNKSQTPSELQYKLHKKLNKLGFLITSLDEEHGLHWNDYSRFGNLRFSNKMIELSEYIFCWGKHDKLWLSNKYSEYKDKFILSGSPRVDLWKNKITLKNKFENKYILFSSNLTIFNHERSWDIVKRLKDLQYDKRDPDAIFKYLLSRGDQYSLLVEFLKAFSYLSYRFPKLDIIIRPHPIEDINAWKEYLKDYKNLKVIREGSITNWINQAEAVIHNGCTSGLEGIISNTPVITFRPLKTLNNEIEFFNNIGFIIQNKKDLGDAIDFAINNKNEFYKNYNKESSEGIKKRIYQNHSDFSANIINTFWEKLKNKFDGQKNLKSYRYKIKILLNLYRIKNYFFSLFKSEKSFKDSMRKHPGISKKEFLDKFYNLCNYAGIDSNKIGVLYISPRVQILYNKKNP